MLSGPAEAAEQLGTNGKLVERLVEWCEAKDHAGVMGESNRLLSALIRHSKSKVRAGACVPDVNPRTTLTTATFLSDIQEVVRTVIQGGGVKHLITMATSEHMIMQNEALVALGLIAGLDLGESHQPSVGLFPHDATWSGQRSRLRLHLLVIVSVSAEKDFVGANLVSVLHKLLSDEKSAPEIKYNSMILICAVMGSGEPHDRFPH